MNISIPMDSDFLVLNLGDMALVLLSTLLLVLVARKYFWNSMKDFVQARRDFIQQSIDSSLKMTTDAESLLEQREAELQEARTQAKEIVEHSKREAQFTHDKIVGEAKKEAADRLEKAVEEIELEKAKAKDEVKNEILEVAFAAAEKVVGKVIDRSSHEKMVNDFIEEVGH